MQSAKAPWLDTEQCISIWVLNNPGDLQILRVCQNLFPCLLGTENVYDSMGFHMNSL